MTTTPMRTRLARVLDPLAFAEPSSVGPRGFENRSPETLDTMTRARQASAFKKVDKLLAELERPSEAFAKEFGRHLYIGPSDAETEGREVLADLVKCIRGGA